MQWPKILAIVRNNIYRMFNDRVALMFMFLIPVGVSTLMGLAFSSDSGDVDIVQSKILVVNQDAGTTSADGREINWGRDLFVQLLVADVPDGLDELIEGEISSDSAKARESVKDGDARAALIIPPQFSAQVGEGTAQVELFYNPGSEVGASVVISIVDSLVASLNNGQAGEQLLVGMPDGYFIELATESGQFDKIAEVAEREIPALYTGETAALITLDSVSVEGDVNEFDPLQYFAPSLAILFMTFTMAAGARGILEEQQNWTLQRIMTTPTPRWVYLLGKLFGTYFTGILQMAILIVVTPIVAVILGRSAGVWGTNYIGIALITLAIVAAGTGIGLLLAAISKTARQADIYGTGVLLIVGILGGTFVPVDTVPFLDALSNISLNKWGLDGYIALSADGASVLDILPNVGVLLAMTAVFFGVALWRFNERLDM